VLIIIIYNYLAIFITNVGVKRLFNITRDIYFYYRYYLKPAIIRVLIIIIYINCFLLLEELDNIKVIKEIKEVKLLKKLEDQEIFKIEDLTSGTILPATPPCRPLFWCSHCARLPPQQRHLEDIGFKTFYIDSLCIWLFFYVVDQRPIR
jgi:hypothetical protein